MLHRQRTIPVTIRRSLPLTPILFPRIFAGLADEFYCWPILTYEHIVDGMAKFRLRFLFVQIGIEFHYTTVAQQEESLRRGQKTKEDW
jgi:hypothetical protein